MRLNQVIVILPLLFLLFEWESSVSYAIEMNDGYAIKLCYHHLNDGAWCMRHGIRSTEHQNVFESYTFRNFKFENYDYHLRILFFVFPFFAICCQSNNSIRLIEMPEFGIE